MDLKLTELYTELGRIEYDLILMKNKLDEYIELKNSTIQKIYSIESMHSILPDTPMDIELKNFVPEYK